MTQGEKAFLGITITGIVLGGGFLLYRQQQKKQLIDEIMTLGAGVPGFEGTYEYLNTLSIAELKDILAEVMRDSNVQMKSPTPAGIRSGAAAIKQIQFVQPKPKPAFVPRGGGITSFGKPVTVKQPGGMFGIKPQTKPVVFPNVKPPSKLLGAKHSPGCACPYCQYC